MFDATGAKIGGEFLVNTTTADNQFCPTITGLTNGGFVVTWMTGAAWAATATCSIKAQVFDAAGAKVGSEFLVNTTTAALKASHDHRS